MNKNIWELYKNSERGKNAISLFTITEEDNIEEKISDIYLFCSDYLGEKKQMVNFLNRFFLISDNILVDNLLLKENDEISEYFNRLIDNFQLGCVDEDKNRHLYSQALKRSFTFNRRKGEVGIAGSKNQDGSKKGLEKEKMSFRRAYKRTLMALLKL